MNCSLCGLEKGRCYCSQIPRLPKRPRIEDNEIITSNPTKPQHYQVAGGKQVIELMEEGMTPEQFEGFLMGNVLKYMYRYPYKNGVEDLNKASEYLKMLIKFKSEE